MSECILRVEKLTNGYTVEIPDEAIQKRNKNPKTPYENPWKEYAFATPAEVLMFVKTHLAKLEPVKDDYSTSFAKAAAEEE